MNNTIKKLDKELQASNRFEEEWLKTSFPIPAGTPDADVFWVLTDEDMEELMKNKIQKSTYAINCKALLEKEEMTYPTEKTLNLLKASVNAFCKYIPSVVLLKRKLEGEIDETHALQRFILAQDKKVDGYYDALEQVRAGRKTTHWIWYIFPQMKGLGYSETSKYYGIRGREEALLYINNPILRDRLVEITRAVLESPRSVSYIFGYDDIKVRSCMKLFSSVSDIPEFKEMLEKKVW